MNGPDLLKELTAVLKESGWLDKATEYMREHPERYTPCKSYNGFIASVTLSVSYQPKDLQDVQNVNPVLFTTVGNIDKIMNEYNEYDTGNIRSRTWSNNNVVAEVFTCR